MVQSVVGVISNPNSIYSIYGVYMQFDARRPCCKSAPCRIGCLPWLRKYLWEGMSSVVLPNFVIYTGAYPGFTEGVPRSAKQANKSNKRATELKPRPYAHQESMFRPY